MARRSMYQSERLHPFLRKAQEAAALAETQQGQQETRGATLKNDLLQQLLSNKGVFGRLFGGGGGGPGGGLGGPGGGLGGPGGGLGGGLSQPGFPEPDGSGGQGGLFSQLRSNRESQINRDFDELEKSQVANLQSRGLGSSSLAGNIGTGIERDKQRAFTDVGTDILDRKINFQQGQQQQQQQQQQSMLQSLLGGLF